MDEKGDHGGDSELETTTAMLMYSKRQLLSKNAFTFLEKHKLLSRTGSQNFIKWRTINQIDFTSTFSRLMGIDIPFGNVGFIIPELFIGNEDNGIKLLKECNRNTKQLYTFVSSYISKQSVTDSDLKEIKDELNHALKLESNSENGRVDIIKTHIELSKKVISSLRQKWAQFNMKFIVYGIILMIISTIIVFFESFEVFIVIVNIKNLGYNLV